MREIVAAEGGDYQDPVSGLKLKTLDGLDLYDRLPRDRELKKLYEPLPNDISGANFSRSSLLVDNPLFNGISINQGEISVVEHVHPQGIDYHIIAIPGRYRLDYGLVAKANHHAQILGPFKLADHPVIEFGQQKQRIIQIQTGRVGLIAYNGNVYPLFPGNYWLKSPMVKFLGQESVNQDVIRKDDFSIIRIPPGHFACYQQIDGSIRELRADANNRYVLRRGQTFLGLHSESTQSVVYGDHAQYQRVFLREGEIVFYRDRSGSTKVLDTPGVHELSAPEYFETKISQARTEIVVHRSNEPSLGFGTIEMVNLRDGEIAFYTDENRETKFFNTPGRHQITAPAFFEKAAGSGSNRIHKATESCLIYGAKAILNLKEGEIAYKYDESGKAILLREAGQHLIDLKKERFDSDRGIQKIYQNDPNKGWYFDLGPFQVVNVPPGHVAITTHARHKENPLTILSAGLHILDDPLWRLDSIQSMQESRIDLGPSEGDRFCEVYTNDRVRFKVNAFLLFKVVEPAKAYVEVSDIQDVLRREAESLLVNLFGKHQAAEITQGVNTSVVKERAPMDPGSEEVAQTYGVPWSFTARLMEEFKTEFENFAKERGVILTRMRVERLDFADPKMKAAVEKQAEEMQRVHVDRQIAEQNRSLEMTRAETLALTSKRRAEGESQASLISTEAAAKQKEIAAAGAAAAKLTGVRAEADAAKLRAEAEAEAAKLTAAAKAQGIRAINDANASLSDHPVLANEKLMRAYFESMAEVYKAAASGGTLIPSGMTLPGEFLQGSAATGMYQLISQFQRSGAVPGFFKAPVEVSTVVSAETAKNDAQQPEKRVQTLEVV